MKHFDVVSYTKVGPIDFGMSQAEVRRLLGEPASSYRTTTAHDADLIDFYNMEIGHVLVGYGAKTGVCVSVEAASPFGLVLLGRDIVNNNYDDLLAWAKARDASMEIDASGFVSHVLGVGLFIESDLDENGRRKSISIEGAIAFCRGYWDKQS
jgi:hypothetical protein